MNSCSDVAGILDGLTTTTSGVVPSTMMGVMSLIESNGIFAYTLGLMTWLLEIMAMWDPSAGAFTRAAVPVMLPAPGRFSITTAWPSAFESDGPTARVIVSTPDPGANGRMMRRGRSDCAAAAALKQSSNRNLTMKPPESNLHQIISREARD